jgi:hypothetical protein
MHYQYKINNDWKIPRRDATFYFVTLRKIARKTPYKYKDALNYTVMYNDKVFLEIFKDFLVLKLHILEVYRTNKFSYLDNFWGLKFFLNGLILA